MIKIILADARTEANMDAIAKAFAISRDELRERVNDGTIAQWYEVGEGDKDNKPHLILSSSELGRRITVDEVGNVVSSRAEPPDGHQPTERPEQASVSETIAPKRSDFPDIRDPDAARRAHLDALLDEALEESFPASDPVAINFDASYPKTKSHEGTS